MSGKKFNLLGFPMMDSPHIRSSGKTSTDFGLGKMRNTVGSTTRIYKHCSKHSPNPLVCTIGSKTQTTNNGQPTPEPTIPEPTVPEPKPVPEPPVITSVTPGNGMVMVYFTQPSSGNTITDYLYSIDGITFVSSGTISSPITIMGLTNGTTYNVCLKAVNANGSSASSESTSIYLPNISIPPKPEFLAPVIIGVVSKTTNSVTISFTQESNGVTITNYKYSFDRRVFTPLSPVDTSSPVTITGLNSGQTYRIYLQATSATGDSEPSKVAISVRTYVVNYAVFTDVGPATWTAPADVTSVEYLIVGGGGGGGGTYSKINVLGNVLVTDTPQAGAYWINSANLTNYRYSGRMYYGDKTMYQNSTSFADPILVTASQNFTPSGVIYSYQKWYNFQMVYLLNDAMPLSTNTTFVMPQGLPSTTYSNNISAGSGGGGGGFIRTSAINPQTPYTVVPGTTYNIYVGAGGTGGIAGQNVENDGSDGEASSFDTLVAAGGAGGKQSRTGFNQNGGGGFDGDNIMGGRGGAGGGRNGGAVINAEAYQWNSTVLRGTYGGTGASINFDGTGAKVYGSGGNGGAPNAAATSTTPANIGKGGTGTGATLNSYANGVDGGSGVVILKYYT